MVYLYGGVSKDIEYIRKEAKKGAADRHTATQENNNLRIQDLLDKQQDGRIFKIEETQYERRALFNNIEKRLVELERK